MAAIDIMPTALDALSPVSKNTRNSATQQISVEQPTEERFVSEPPSPYMSDEYKLPKTGNLLIVIGGNVVHHLSFSIIVSSAAIYAEHLDCARTNEESGEVAPSEEFRLSWRQKGVIATMSWFAMVNYFILGGIEANIPIYTSVLFGYSPFNAGNFIALGGLIIFPFLLLNVRLSRFLEDRVTLALGSTTTLAGLLIMLALMHTNQVTRASYFVVWVLVALGCNLASTCTVSLLSKQLPGDWNGKTSMVIQYSSFAGRVTGAVWGGAGVSVGTMNFVGLQIAMVGIGLIMYLTLWKNLKTKTG